MTSDSGMAQHIGSVARALWGEPNERLSTKRNLRFGTHGARSVDLEKGVWHDHEKGYGGGVVDLIAQETGLRGSQTLEWMRDKGIHPICANGQGSSNGRMPSRLAGLGKIVAQHSYLDEAGEELFQVVVCEPKAYRQRRRARPDERSRDGWVWSILGVRQVPFNLPVIREAISLGQPIFIVEGEKDVVNLDIKFALPATCNAGGAGKWPAELTTHFTGADVIILADNDEAGRKHRDKVAAALKPVAKRVRLIDLPNLPHKGDVSNWIEAGGTAEQLWQLVETRAEDFGDRTNSVPVEDQCNFGVQILRASELKPKPIRWLWEGFLARGKFHLIAGSPGTGKTTLAVAMGAIVTAKGHWPDRTAVREAGDVLVWSGEDDIYDSLLPRFMACGANTTCVHFVDAALDPSGRRPFDPARDMPSLAAQAKHLTNLRMLVVDPVVSAVAGDSHKNAEVRRALQPLVDLGVELDCCVVGITHFTKGTQGRDPTERVTGSLAFGALPRVVFCTAKPVEEALGHHRLVRAKSNIGPDGGGLEYDLRRQVIDGHPGITGQYIKWGELIKGSARALLLETEAQDDDGKSFALGEAKRFLLDLLKDGPVAVTKVKNAAREAAHSWPTIRRAQKKLAVRAIKRGMDEGWSWQSPGGTEETA